MNNGKNILDGQVRQRASVYEETIHEIKESNSPNWKNRANDFAQSIKGLEFHPISTLLGDFSSSIDDAFGDAVSRHDIFHAIQENTPIKKFPMTCIKNFSEAHEIFVLGKNTAYLEVLNRVTSYINEN